MISLAQRYGRAGLGGSLLDRSGVLGDKISVPLAIDQEEVRIRKSLNIRYGCRHDEGCVLRGRSR